MKPQTALFILFALLLAACGSVAPTPQGTVISEMTVPSTPTATVTLTPTSTATAIPTVPAEFDFATIEGMTHVDGAYIYTDGQGEKWTFGEGIGAKEDGGNITIGAVKIDLATKLVTPVVADVPRTMAEVNELPAMVITEGSPNEEAMWQTVRDIVFSELAGSDKFDPKVVFEGIVVDDYLVTTPTVDVTPNKWIMKDFPNDQSISLTPSTPAHLRDGSYDDGFYYRHNESRPLKVVSDAGLVRVTVRRNGSSDMDLIALPVLAVNPDKTLVRGVALTKAAELETMIDYFDPNKAMYLDPHHVSYGNPPISEKNEAVRASDPELRQYVSELNAQYLTPELIEELRQARALPTEWFSKIFLDIQYTVDHR